MQSRICAQMNRGPSRKRVRLNPRPRLHRPFLPMSNVCKRRSPLCVLNSVRSRTRFICFFTDFLADKAQKDSQAQAAKAQVLFDEVAAAAQQQKSAAELASSRGELEQLHFELQEQRREFNEAAVGLGKDRASLEVGSSAAFNPVQRFELLTERTPHVPRGEESLATRSSTRPRPFANSGARGAIRDRRIARRTLRSRDGCLSAALAAQVPAETEGQAGFSAQVTCQSSPPLPPDHRNWQADVRALVRDGSHISTIVISLTYHLLPPTTVPTIAPASTDRTTREPTRGRAVGKRQAPVARALF
jgi:hypothetical protein